MSGGAQKPSDKWSFLDKDGRKKHVFFLHVSCGVGRKAVLVPHKETFLENIKHLSTTAPRYLSSNKLDM